MIIRPLGADDAPLLAQFNAFLKPRGWEEVVDEMIRVHLPGLLSTGAEMTVVGAFSKSGELVGVVAWQGSDVDGVAVVPLLAVRFGQQHHGIGRLLKENAMNRCRESGYRAVRSVVHRDNKAMISLNERLGARVAPHPDDPYNNYFACIIVLDSR